MKIVVFNLGCKVNKYESDSIARALREKGHDVVCELEKADVYILNTCAVTNEAERKSRQCVTRCLKLNPSAKVIVAGCASQANGAQFEKKKGVTYISGVAGKRNIVDELDKAGMFIEPLPTVYEDMETPSVERTRAYVKVQDGCDNFCSYCLIPYLRGRSRSRSVDDAVAECEKLANDTGEIVLTGIDLSSFGKNTGSSLAELVERLDGIDCRIRLGSLEQGVIDRRFLEATKRLKKFCPQFHLSLQSGADAVLKKMNRHYTTDEYFAKVQLIREYYHDANVTTDLICGFPTETDEDFEETKNFIQKVGFGQVHVFGYSARKGTVAAKYRLLPPGVVAKRCEEAQRIAAELHAKYLSSLVGKKIEVLFEEEQDGYIAGYGREYARVYAKGAKAGQIIRVTATELFRDGLLANISEE